MHIAVFECDLDALVSSVDRLMSEEHRLLNDKALLFEAQNTGKGLQYLIDTAYKMLANPITVVDSTFKLLAMNSDVAEDCPDLELQRQTGYIMNSYKKSEQCQFIKKCGRTISLLLCGTGITTRMDNGSYSVYGIEAAQKCINEPFHNIPVTILN